MAIISKFYKRLRDLCEERNMTVNELVKILELSSGSPTAWKNGAIPRNATLVKIADYFGVTKDFLSEEESENVPAASSGRNENAPNELILTEGEMRILSAFREMSPERQKALAELLGISEVQK